MTAQLDIATFAWMTDDGDLPKYQRVSWWDNHCKLMQRYVTNLADGIDRTLSLPHRKVLFTNRMDWFQDFHDRFFIIEIDARFRRITNKFIAYDPAFPLSERFILTDLDMVFVSNWDNLANYDGRLIMNHDRGERKGWRRWYPGGGFIMTNQRTALFDPITRPLYTDAEAVYRQCRYRERHWFAQQIGPKHIDYWQRDYPKSLASFKKDILKRKQPVDAYQILWFHGDPRPHEVPAVGNLWEPSPA